MVALRTFLLVAVVLESRGIVVAETTETGFLNRSVILDGVEYPYQTLCTTRVQPICGVADHLSPAWSGRAR